MGKFLVAILLTCSVLFVPVSSSPVAGSGDNDVIICNSDGSVRLVYPDGVKRINGLLSSFLDLEDDVFGGVITRERVTDSDVGPYEALEAVNSLLNSLGAAAIADSDDHAESVLGERSSDFMLTLDSLLNPELQPELNNFILAVVAFNRRVQSSR